MRNSFLTAKDLSNRMKISIRSVWTYRDMGFMPAPIKLRGAVRWREGDIEKWIEAGCPDCRKISGGKLS